jgi:hypothetical protein
VTLNTDYIRFMNALSSRLNSTTAAPLNGTALCARARSRSARIATAHLTLRLTLRARSPRRFTELTNNYLTAPGQVKNGWGFDSFSSFLFSFELLSTIGYGEIAPKTVGGRLWLCVFSLLTIPLGGVCLSRIASCGMELFEWGLQCVDPHLKQMFEAFDQDRDKLLSEAEALHALTAIQGAQPTEAAFQAQYAEAHVLQRDPRGLSFEEFARLYTLADNAQLQHKRKWRKLYVSSFTVSAWLVIGMFAFNHFEAWGFMPSFYFCFVTLTTVGLGDFYPSAPCVLPAAASA